MSSMEANAAYKIVAFIFDDGNKALAISDGLAAAKKYEAYQVVAHAVVEVDDKGKSHLRETGHGGLGAAAGVVVGGLLGLIGGPAGLLLFTIAGAAVGGMAGQISGRMISNEDMERLATQMQPGTSALMALAEETEAQTLVTEMAGYEAQVIMLEVSGEVSEEIHHATAIPGEPAALAKASADDIRYEATLPGEAPTRKTRPSST